ncbi:hypothetical protein CCACVL1_30570, partial [Corchorus capsularis]
LGREVETNQSSPGQRLRAICCHSSPKEWTQSSELRFKSFLSKKPLKRSPSWGERSRPTKALQVKDLE